MRTRHLELASASAIVRLSADCVRLLADGDLITMLYNIIRHFIPRDDWL